MDHNKRTIAKAVTWQGIGFVSMIGLGYWATGSLSSAGGLAMASMAVGAIFYVIHERVWNRVAWGRRPPHA